MKLQVATSFQRPPRQTAATAPLAPSTAVTRPEGETQTGPTTQRPLIHDTKALPTRTAIQLPLPCWTAWNATLILEGSLFQFHFFIFNWRTIPSPCCVGFCCIWFWTTKPTIGTGGGPESLPQKSMHKSATSGCEPLTDMCVWLRGPLKNAAGSEVSAHTRERPAAFALGFVAQSCLTPCDPMDCIAHQAPLSMGFSSQEYWSGYSSWRIPSIPSPGDLSDQESNWDLLHYRQIPHHLSHQGSPRCTLEDVNMECSG